MLAVYNITLADANWVKVPITQPLIAALKVQCRAAHTCDVSFNSGSTFWQVKSGDKLEDFFAQSHPIDVWVRGTAADVIEVAIRTAP